MQSLKNKEVLLGVTGGIAAYKAADLCSKLIQQDARVSVVMTKSALEFIGRTTFEALTNRPVHVDPYQVQEHFRGEHIGVAQRADVAIVAPATAASVARLAMGLSEDLLTTTLLVVTCPVFIAPAMNCDMWAKPQVQRNVQQLRDDGYHLVDPEEGWLSCRQLGAGRMASPESIIDQMKNSLPDM